MHQHSGGAWSALELVPVLFLLAALFLYLRAVFVERRKGRQWPLRHIVLWTGGILFAGAGFVGPLAAQAHTDFTAHMTAHLLVGMLAPILLVSAAPVTLALRSLRLASARRLARLLKSTPVRLLSHPVSAAVLNVGSLWVLYASPVGVLMQADAPVHLLLQTHFLLTGYLFTAAVIGMDPTAHRSGYGLRTAVLILAIAGHGILSKYIYANPPAEVPVEQAEAGGVLMYYGGNAADLVLITVFCAQWYRKAGRRIMQSA